MASNALTTTILLGLALVTVLPAASVAAGDLPEADSGLDWVDCLQTAADAVLDSAGSGDADGWADPDEPYCGNEFDAIKP